MSVGKFRPSRMSGVLVHLELTSLELGHNTWHEPELRSGIILGAYRGLYNQLQYVILISHDKAVMRESGEFVVIQKPRGFSA